MAPTKKLQVIKLGQPNGWRIDSYVSVEALPTGYVCRQCKNGTKHRYPSTDAILETYAEHGKVFLCPKELAKMGHEQLSDRTWCLKCITYDQFTEDRFTLEQYKSQPSEAPLGTQKTQIKLQREKVRKQIDRLRAEQEVLLRQRTYWEMEVAEKQGTDLNQVQKSLSDKQRQIFRLWVILDELDGRIKYLRKQAWRKFFSMWLPVDPPSSTETRSGPSDFALEDTIMEECGRL
ncbi:uncharacterized protein FIESC28_01635 [Fusarium coffeatum]|uniref:Uncharacterized protein n=1 Tax=Fusarium coffeatum TaxID=231269 RepID=A0A366S9K5_9HYPO|nr:uncharacterized protein FIESC28_01635 [Fusarium coffeatum]RBR25672.1 hypothetical protein FIESC28_01635 [Fusarium coffeatum]